MSAANKLFLALATILGLATAPAAAEPGVTADKITLGAF